MNRPKQAVVLCGGRGKRLRPYTDHIPKPMVSCNEKPFLWYLLQQMSDQGIREFVLLTGYLGGIIENYFGDGRKWGWDIQKRTDTRNWHPKTVAYFNKIDKMKEKK